MKCWGLVISLENFVWKKLAYWKLSPWEFFEEQHNKYSAIIPVFLLRYLGIEDRHSLGSKVWTWTFIHFSRPLTFYKTSDNVCFLFSWGGRTSEVLSIWAINNGVNHQNCMELQHSHHPFFFCLWVLVDYISEIGTNAHFYILEWK